MLGLLYSPHASISESHSAPRRRSMRSAETSPHLPCMAASAYHAASLIVSQLLMKSNLRYKNCLSASERKTAPSVDCTVAT